jgi:hypothetical protein
MTDYEDLMFLLKDPSFPLTSQEWVDRTYHFLRTLTDEELVEMLRMSMCSVAWRLTGGVTDMSQEEFKHALLEVTRLMYKLVRENKT